MKKKYLWSLCTLPIVFSPALLAISHCSPLYTSLKEITTTTTTTPYENLKKAKPSLNTLLYGDKHYNGGNYVVIIGTSNNGSGDNLNNFLFKDSSFWSKDDEANQIVSQDAPIIQTSQDIKDNFLTYDYNRKDSFAIDTYMEAERIADQRYGLSDDYSTWSIKKGDPLSPFDKFTKGDYLYHDSKNKYKEGKYIRQDKDAKQYRKLAHELTKLFSSADLSTSSVIALQWVFGHPVANPLSTSEWTGSDAFYKTVTDNFKTGIDNGWSKK